MATWGLALAKAQLSEVVERANVEGAQQITRNGKLVGILVSPDQWEKRERQPAPNVRSMSEFFKHSPIAGSGLNLPRSNSKVRKVSL